MCGALLDILISKELLVLISFSVTVLTVSPIDNNGSDMFFSISLRISAFLRLWWRLLRSL